METRIGISGWLYPPWRGVFFPKGLSQKKELEFASRQFPTIEINSTFYRLQRPSSFKKWYESTPPDFVFAVKANGYITHVKRLEDISEPMGNFFASGVLALKEKLGPLLWQFPPSFKFDEKKFERFLKILPHDFRQARKLVAKRASWMEGRTYIPPLKEQNFKIRHAVEIRNKSFDTPAFLKLLKKYKVAIVTADTAGKWPLIEAPTADFLYLRLHGDAKIYESGYTRAALQLWAKRIRRLRKPGRDIYAYFDNDVKVRAPFDALTLARLLGRKRKARLRRASYKTSENHVSI